MAVMENNKIKQTRIMRLPDALNELKNRKLKSSSAVFYKAFFETATDGLLFNNNKLTTLPRWSTSRYFKQKINAFVKLCLFGGSSKRNKWTKTDAVVFYPWTHLATFGLVLRFKKGRRYVLGRTLIFSDKKLKKVQILNSRDISGAKITAKTIKLHGVSVKYYSSKRHMLVGQYKAKKLLRSKHAKLTTVRDFSKLTSQVSVDFSSLKISTACFYGAALVNSNRLASNELAKLYRNTFHASLYGEFRDHATSATIKKVSCYFKMQQSITTSIQSADVLGNFKAKKKPQVRFKYSGPRTYLNTFGPISRIGKRNRMLTIRFTPGYLPFFRKIRARFARTRRLKYKRQWQITRYVARYHRLSNSAMLRYYALTLKQVIVALKFAYNIVNADIMIACGTILVNGVQARGAFFQLYKYDIVSMRANYYNYSLIIKHMNMASAEALKFYTSIMRTNEFKNKKLSSKLNSYNRYLYRKFDKIKYSRIDRIYCSMSDVPNYFELDYLTLSAVVLFESTNMRDYDQVFVRSSSFSFIRMLNWKYMC